MGRIIDMTDKRFTRLTVINQAGKNHRNAILWNCLCDCGVKLVVIGHSLRNGNTKSCGCYNIDSIIKRNKLKKTHGMRESPEYSVWVSMKDRCTNLNGQKYESYMKRGIAVCDRWKDSFENFYEDMGPRPSNKYSLDRINNNGNYEPSNCRWATITEQNRNRRGNSIKDINEANDIRNKYLTGQYTHEQLASEHNCSRQMVGLIINNKNWKQ